jgi:hypothetical protein
MSNLLGIGSSRASQAPTIATALRIQSSVQGKPLPFGWGESRIAGNLIWAGNFQHTGPGGGGKLGGKGGGGGGKGGQQQTTYSAAVAIALAEGPIANIGQVWSSQNLTSLAALNLTLFTGSHAQQAWSYLTGAQSTTPGTPTAEQDTIPTNLIGPPTVTVAQAASFLADGGVVPVDATTGQPIGFSGFGGLGSFGGFTRVPANPAQGQYAVGAGVYTFNAADSGMPVQISYSFGSTTTQAPLGQALNYRGLAYVAAGPMQLGTSPVLPNLSFEVLFALNGALPGLPDADPSAVLSDFLTNAFYGLGFPAANLGAPTTWRNYCLALGLVVSPVVIDQQEAAQLIKDLLLATNSEAVWSGGALTVVPYGDTALSGNGFSYTPPAPLYNLGDDDFKARQGSNPNSAAAASTSDPIQCTRLRPADQMNSITIEYLDRANAYNPTVVEAKDDAAINAFGLRKKDTKQLHLFANGNAAIQSVQLQLGREQIRNTYCFTLGQEYILLDPMDVIELTEAATGLAAQTVRVVEITENPDSTLTCICEDFLQGSGSSPVYNTQTNQGLATNFNAAAPSVNTPVFIEPTDQLAGDLELDIALSGGANWGGCLIYVSADGDSYALLGKYQGTTRMGTLTAAVATVTAAAAGLTIDQTNTLAVDISEVPGAQLLSGSINDVLAGNTLCWVDGELIAYETAVLTGPGKYTLSYLNRGLLGTAPAAHGAGAAFVRLDGVLFRMPFSQDRIGATLFFKFVSFNPFGGGAQAVADVPFYSYKLQGLALASPLPDIANLVAVYNANLTQLSWSEISDFRPVMYEVRQGAAWAGAQVLGRVAHPPFTVGGDGTYWVAGVAQPTAGLTIYSAHPQSIALTGATLNRNVVGSFEEDPGWTGSVSGAAGVSGSTVVLTNQGNILAISDWLNTPDILQFGALGTSGAYTIPAGHEIDVQCVAPCLVSISYTSIGQAANAPNVLAVSDWLNAQDILGNAASANVSVFPQLQTSQDAVTFGAWQNFVPGVYNARKFNARMQLLSLDGATVPVLETMKFTVDAPDRIDDTIGKAIAAGGTAIAYTPNGSGTAAPFNGGPGGAALPQLQVTVLGAAAGDTINITAQTLAGFTLQITNGGVGVARNCNILAKGF